MVFHPSFYRIEKWCNEFSSAFLLPKDLAKSIFDTNKANLTKKETLTYLSNKYKVSKAMLLLNMFKLNYIGRADYDAILARFKNEDIKPKKEAEEAKNTQAQKNLATAQTVAPATANDEVARAMGIPV